MSSRDGNNVISIFRGQKETQEREAPWTYELLTLSDCSLTVWRRVIGADTAPQKLVAGRWVPDQTTMGYLDDRGDARQIYVYRSPALLPDAVRQEALKATETEKQAMAAST